MPNPGLAFRLLTIITLTSGTAFIMWLGEQITERGIGNGISLIIFAGIVVRMPMAIANTFSLYSSGNVSLLLIIFLAVMMVAVVAFIVFAESGQRKIPVQYARRVVGRKMLGGQSTYIPLKINTSGVIPPIFASAIIMFPATILQFINVPALQNLSTYLSPGSALYEVLFVFFILFFCYFYTAVVFNPEDLAENLKKYGGLHPGGPPGEEDRGVHRQGGHPHHARRGDLRRVHLRAPGPADLEAQRALLLRRDVADDRGGHGAGHGDADRVAPADAALQGFFEEVGMIQIKTAGEIERMRQAGQAVAETLEGMRDMVRPGLTTRELDRFAEEALRARGMRPAFKGYRGFPASICASPNEVVVHGFPSDRPLAEGDILSLDLGAEYQGYYGDAALTVPVGRVSPEAERLLRVTEEALRRGLEQARPGNRLHDISWAIQSFAEEAGYGVVREYVGHGIGRSMHEDPQVPNFGRAGQRAAAAGRHGPGDRADDQRRHGGGRAP